MKGRVTVSFCTKLLLNVIYPCIKFQVDISQVPFQVTLQTKNV